MNIIMGNLVTLGKEGEFDLIAHGCNCLKTFGAGIALDFKRNFRSAWQADQDEEEPALGNISLGWEEDYDLMVVNCYTQHNVGKPSDVNKRNPFGHDTTAARYLAMRSCFQFISIEFSGEHVGLPLIGCGLAGLEWDVVEQIIKEELKTLEVTVVVFDEKTREKFNITLTE